MPLVRIELHQGRSEGELAAIGDVVHQAMVETIAVPADDRFQVARERVRQPGGGRPGGLVLRGGRRPVRRRRPGRGRFVSPGRLVGRGR